MAAASSAITSAVLRESRKIICAGRNYREHAKELGNAVPTEPFWFLKPPSSLVLGTDDVEGVILVPSGSENVHHEVELALIVGGPAPLTAVRAAALKKAIGSDASSASERLSSVLQGYAVSIDVTERAIQSAARAKQLPWTAAKGFDTFTAISPVIESSSLADPLHTRLFLTVNGETRQDDHTSSMVFDIPSLLAHVTRITTLYPNDVILTGTPAGVGPLVPGDRVLIGLGNPLEPLLTARFRVDAAPALPPL